jgi:hypothetical protein
VEVRWCGENVRVSWLWVAGYVGVVVGQAQQDRSSSSHLDSVTGHPERSARMTGKGCQTETCLKEARGMRQKQLVVRRVSFRSATCVSY